MCLSWFVGSALPRQRQHGRSRLPHGLEGCSSSDLDHPVVVGHTGIRIRLLKQKTQNMSLLESKTREPSTSHGTMGWLTQLVLRDTVGSYCTRKITGRSELSEVNPGLWFANERAYTRSTGLGNDSNPTFTTRPQHFDS